MYKSKEKDMQIIVGIYRQEAINIKLIKYRQTEIKWRIKQNKIRDE